MAVESYKITQPIVFAYDVKLDGQRYSGFAFSYSLCDLVRSALTRKYGEPIEILDYEILGRHVDYIGAFEYAVASIQKGKALGSIPKSVASLEELNYFTSIQELLVRSCYEIGVHTRDWYLLSELIDLWLSEYSDRLEEIQLRDLAG